MTSFLTDRESELWELLYFKVYSYCLEIICADFPAGANIDEANPNALVLSLRRVYELLPHEQQSQSL